MKKLTSPLIHEFAVRGFALKFHFAPKVAILTLKSDSNLTLKANLLLGKDIQNMVEKFISNHKKNYDEDLVKNEKKKTRI